MNARNWIKGVWLTCADKIVMADKRINTTARKKFITTFSSSKNRSGKSEKDLIITDPSEL